jgi:hypothetical protein
LLLSNQKRYKQWLILRTLIAVIMVTHIMSTPVALAESEIHKPIEFFEGVATMPTQSESEARKETNLREWMQKLKQKESGGDCDISIMDVNGKRSTGAYMYQDATWLGMGKKYNLPTTLENITSCDMQEELTYRILKDGGYRHWTCSTLGCPEYGIVGIGTPPVI